MDATTATPAAQAGFTLNDIEIGVRLVEALVHHLKKAGAVPITYPDLLELGRFLDPKDAAMARAEPLGIAAKLRFVTLFCQAHGYPDLASLARHPLAPPAGAAEPSLATCDWPEAMAQLADFAAAASAAVPRRFKPRKERPAEVAWYAYFSAHREACKGVGSSDKREIINLVMAGLDPETALRRFLAAKAVYEAGG